MVNIPLFTWFYTSQVVQDFFHQQYLTLTNQPGKLLNADQTIGKPLGFWVGNTAKNHGENTSFGVAVVGCGVQKKDVRNSANGKLVVNGSLCGLDSDLGFPSERDERDSSRLRTHHSGPQTTEFLFRPFCTDHLNHPFKRPVFQRKKLPPSELRTINICISYMPGHIYREITLTIFFVYYE